MADYAAEWKWDGIRVQIVHAGGETRLYSRSGDDISASFPEIVAALDIPGVLDGELLVRGSHQGGTEGGAASRSEEHTSELQSLRRISYAVFCLKKKNTQN